MVDPSRDRNQDGHRACFLGLPRELRDLIYLHLVEEKVQQPEDPDHPGERLPNWKSPCTIYFEARCPKPSLLQLKLCNQQIHTEVCDTLAKHVTRDSGPAHLDIMVRGSTIWPTWISLPPTRHLDPTIRVNLRIFELVSWGSEFSTGAYRGLWSLFNVLAFQGPLLIHNRKGLPRPLQIGKLRFEIFLCFPTSVDDLFGTYRDVFDRIERLASDNVGLGNIESIEACMGADKRAWKLRQLPTGLTFGSRV